MKLYARNTMRACLLGTFMYLAFPHMKGTIIRILGTCYWLIHDVLPEHYLHHNLTYIICTSIIEH